MKHKNPRLAFVILLYFGSNTASYYLMKIHDFIYYMYSHHCKFILSAIKALESSKKEIISTEVLILSGERVMCSLLYEDIIVTKYYCHLQFIDI